MQIQKVEGQLTKHEVKLQVDTGTLNEAEVALQERMLVARALRELPPLIDAKTIPVQMIDLAYSYINMIIGDTQVLLASGDIHIDAMYQLPESYKGVTPAELSPQETLIILSNMLAHFFEGANHNVALSVTGGHLDKIQERLRSEFDPEEADIDGAMKIIGEAMDSEADPENPSILEEMNTNYHFMMFAHNFRAITVSSRASTAFSYALDNVNVQVSDFHDLDLLMEIYCSTLISTSQRMGSVSELIQELEDMTVNKNNQPFVEELRRQLDQFQSDSDAHRSEYPLSYRYSEELDEAAHRQAKIYEYISDPTVLIKIKLINESIEGLSLKTYSDKHTLLLNWKSLCDTFGVEFPELIDPSGAERISRRYLGGLIAKVNSTKPKLLQRIAESRKLSINPDLVVAANNESSQIVQSRMLNELVATLAHINDYREEFNRRITAELESKQKQQDFRILSLFMKELDFEAGLALVANWKLGRMAGDLEHPIPLALADVVTLELAGLLLFHSEPTEEMQMFLDLETHQEAVQIEGDIHVLEQALSVPKLMDYQNKIILAAYKNIHSQYSSNEMATTSPEKAAVAAIEAATGALENLNSGGVFADLGDLIDYVNFRVWKILNPQMTNHPPIAQMEMYKQMRVRSAKEA